ncbi:MAG TPA: anti-sigma factor [Ilumatobacteraceae bacterium]|nr:anti-sigma factor [Ilumatobacteraceae bacterium]
MNDDDRIAYLAGEPTGSIDDSDERADLDELRALLADPGLWDEPAPGLEDAVVAAVSGAVGARPGHTVAPMPPAAISTAAPTTSISPTESSASVIPIARHRSRWTRSVVLMGAAAAAVIAVVATMVVLTGGQDDRETFSMVLEPTDALPAAAGEATLIKTDSGWQIELDATGLPRLDEGDFYQAWLRNEDGTLVPIGTFNEGADVVLWAGVSPVLFPTLTVTRETADNVQDSSGDRVLVGTITQD